jgi:hypothetical protein
MNTDWFGISKNCPGLQVQRETIAKVGAMMLTNDRGRRFARETPDIIWVEGWAEAKAERLRCARQCERQAENNFRAALSTLKQVEAVMGLSYEEYISRELKKAGL